MGYIIVGEYDRVVRASRDATTLTVAHSIPMERPEALRLITALTAQYQLPDPIVKWTAKRGRGGIQRRHDFTRTPYLSLPRSPSHGTGLRAGLVLHEYAHVLTVWHDGGTGHGPAFVRRLDELVAWWADKWLTR